MKMNKKGTTLTELLVSITMLSVAIILMYGLMANLQKKKNAEDKKADDLIKIADIEKSFQDLVMEPCNYGKQLVSINYIANNGVDNGISVQYTTANNLFYSWNLTLDGNSVSLECKSQSTCAGKSRKWTLEKSCSLLYENIEKNPYNVVFKCGNGSSTDYIKLPMYFKTT